jgi:hypothetical protein
MGSDSKASMTLLTKVSRVNGFCRKKPSSKNSPLPRL